MTRRLLLSLASGIVGLCLGLGRAEAGQVTLPLTPPSSSLSDLLSTVPPTPLPTGPFAIVGNLEFSNFVYSSATVPASSITVNPLDSNGIQFASIPAFATAGQTVDVTISYTVTALSGTISNASLLIAGGATGTGLANVVETISWTTPDGGTATADHPLQAFSPGTGPSKLNDAVTFPAQTTINVLKDIILTGGTDGTATVSATNQTFSTTGVIPEPASMALLGIGLTGLFTFRRFFKRAFVA